MDALGETSIYLCCQEIMPVTKPCILYFIYIDAYNYIFIYMQRTFDYIYAQSFDYMHPSNNVQPFF